MERRRSEKINIRHSEKKHRNSPFHSDIFNVRLKLHFTWWLAFVFIIVIIATQFPEAYSIWRRVGLGVAVSLIFLIVLIIRQYAITILALSRQVRLKAITLYIIGGVPGISRQLTTPLVEILLGTAGLLFSLVIVMLFYMAYVALIIYGNTIMAGIFSWLIYFMLLFTFFHIIPGYPTDGGRIVRALLWKSNRNYYRSTRITTWIGQATGIVFGGIGIALMLLGQRWILGSAVMFIGWVTFIATAQINRLMRLHRDLQDIRLADIAMSHECPNINYKMTVKRLVSDYIVTRGHYFFIVTDQDKFAGCISLREIRRIPKRLWDRTTVEKASIPATKVYTATTEQSAADVLEHMLELDLEQIPVLQDNKTAGLIDRDDLIHLACVRRSLTP